MKNKYFSFVLILFTVLTFVTACDISGEKETTYTSSLERLQTPQVSAESYNGVIRLSWGPDANADAYYVVRKGSGVSDVVLLDKELAYECSDWASNGYSFEHGKTYTYYVTALSGKANGGISRSGETLYTYIQNSSAAIINVKAKNPGEGTPMEEIELDVSSQIYNGACYTIVKFRPVQYNEKVVVEYKLGDTEFFSASPSISTAITVKPGVSQVRLPDLAGSNYIRLTNYFAGEDTDYYESVSSEISTNGIESNYFGVATELKTSRSGNYVKLEWAGAENATSYSIYRIESDGLNTTEPEWFEICNYADGLMKNNDGKWYFIDTDAEAIYNYFYVVIAFKDDVRSNSSASVVYKATLPKIENFVISSISDDGVVLMWDDDGYSTFELSYAKINAYNYQNEYSTLDYTYCDSLKPDQYLRANTYMFTFDETVNNCALVFRLTNSYGDVAYQLAQKAGTDYDYALLQKVTAATIIDAEKVQVKLQLVGQSVSRGTYSVYERTTDVNGLPKENWKKIKGPIGAETGIIPINEDRPAYGSHDKYYQYRVCQSVNYANQTYEINYIDAKDSEAEDAAIITVIVPEQDL